MSRSLMDQFDALFPAPAGESATSPARRAANRANARKSTGPRTQAGKARSRANAVTHGLFCRRLLVSSASLRERPEESDALHQAWRSELKPCGRRESDLVELICVNLMRRRRYLELEGVLLQKLDRDPAGDGLERFLRGAASRQSALASIGREVRAWTRELEQAQTRRLGGKAPDWVNRELDDPAARFALAPPAGFVAEPAPPPPARLPWRNTLVLEGETAEHYAERMNRLHPLPPPCRHELRNGIPFIAGTQTFPLDQPIVRDRNRTAPDSGQREPAQPAPGQPPGSPEARSQADQPGGMAAAATEGRPLSGLTPLSAPPPAAGEDSGVLVTLRDPWESPPE